MSSSHSTGNHLLEILTVLSREKVDFIIYGGVAAVLHGVERMTLDIDLAVDTGTENLLRFLHAMELLAMVPRAPVAPGVLLDKAFREQMVKEKGALVFTFLDPEQPFKQIDVSLKAELSYTALITHTIKKTIGKTVVKCVSVEKLLQLKERVEHPRQKDLLDIAALKRMLDR
jgi:hypothetical protein